MPKATRNCNANVFLYLLLLGNEVPALIDLVLVPLAFLSVDVCEGVIVELVPVPIEDGEPVGG